MIALSAHRLDPLENNGNIIRGNSETLSRKEQHQCGARGSWYGHATQRLYCSFAYSALACVKMGMSESAFSQSLKKSLYAVSALTRPALASAPREVLVCRAFARATPRCANAPVQQFQTMPLCSRIFWNSAAACVPCRAAKYADVRARTRSVPFSKLLIPFLSVHPST